MLNCLLKDKQYIFRQDIYEYLAVLQSKFCQVWSIVQKQVQRVVNFTGQVAVVKEERSQVMKFWQILMRSIFCPNLKQRKFCVTLHVSGKKNAYVCRFLNIKISL
jgi:hypothetical protein